MATFKEANQVRTVLKMKLARYEWYKGSAVCSASDGWGIVVSVTKVDNKVRKLIPPVSEGISVKTEAE
jgi:hypothetical protein